MKGIWEFIQNQILGMRWLNDLIGRGIRATGFDTGTRYGESIQFFLYDTIKILILLSVLIFGISYIQSFFPPERTKKILGKFHGVKANIISALLGTVTPFCSCSSIPLFIGFTNAGLPLGVTFSFLISSPLVDLGAFIMLISVFGVKIALSYVIVGLILAVIGGTLIERLHLEAYVVKFTNKGGTIDIDAPDLSVRERLSYSFTQVKATVKKVFLYILIGVGIGAVIHNWIPREFIQTILGTKNPFSVVLATLVGAPMYADIFESIPIAEALYQKGVGVGTILSFMMGVTALSLPSMIMLNRVVKTKLLAVFFGIVVIGIILIGYVFNAFHAFFII